MDDKMLAALKRRTEGSWGVGYRVTLSCEEAADLIAEVERLQGEVESQRARTVYWMNVYLSTLNAWRDERVQSARSATTEPTKGRLQ